MKRNNQMLRIVAVALVVLGVIAYLAVTGVESNKSYYVTIRELQAMGNKAYARHLRVSGTVEPGSIRRDGTNMRFVLTEQGRTLNVNYTGQDPAPDTFKDNAMALAIGTLDHNGNFHATELQAKCASKYAPAAPSTTAATTDKAALRTPASMQPHH